MRILLQRVSGAGVKVTNGPEVRIGKGILVFAGIEDCDEEEDADWLAQKLVKLRIFPDKEGVMNLSLNEVGGEVLVVSQFTLHASTRKGNRPSYIRAARPDKAIPLYRFFISRLDALLEKPVSSGVFGADMKVSLENDGPVTLWIDSRQKE